MHRFALVDVFFVNCNVLISKVTCKHIVVSVYIAKQPKTQSLNVDYDQLNPCVLETNAPIHLQPNVFEK